ncbi:MAG: hypothetical protein AAF618_00615 [Pseudomonadota bacterium]
MWGDAFVINRPFRRFLPAAAILVSIALTYFLWAELIVAPFSETPLGSVTTGLPYPFLNSMELGARISFYATNTGLAVALLAVFFGLGALITRWAGDRPPLSEARPGRLDSSDSGA